MTIEYAELHSLSNFTFLRGASHAEELVMRAHELGYRALAITDECSVAGVVRAHTAAKKYNFSIIVGSEFRLACGLRFIALAVDRASYGRLCRLITRGRRSAQKGEYSLTRHDVEEILQGCLMLWLPALRPKRDEIEWLNERFRGNVWIAAELLLNGADDLKLKHLQSIGRELDIPLVASGDVHMHVRARQPLQDALTAVRHGVPVSELGMRLYSNGERYLRERQRLAKLYPPELLSETLQIAE